MRVELSDRRSSFPSQCTCCGAFPKTNDYLAFATTHLSPSTPREWQFPLCTQCQTHVAISQRGAFLTILLTGLSVLGAFVSMWAFAGGATLAFAMAKEAYLKAQTVQCPTCAATFLRDHTRRVVYLLA